MKILDRYILTTYLKTFFSVFAILILIFVLQTVWLYIKELAGKDLDITIVAKFLVYMLPKLIPLVLPLTILLASIMVFGSFAENYEFAAMKSTGISLQRAMSGLSVFIVILGITTFFFSNNVIPWAELKSYNLRRNIAKLKPSMYIAEGQFNAIDETGYNIKVEKKSGDRGQYLEDVTIHMKGETGNKNAAVIKAKTGELTSAEDSEVLKLILFDGNLYQDIEPENNTIKAREENRFVKSAFEKKIINIDLSSMNNVDLDEEMQTDKYNMLDVVDLNKTIDSLIIKDKAEHESFANNLQTRSSIPRVNASQQKSKTSEQEYTGEVLDIFNTEDKIKLVESAIRGGVSTKQLLSTKKITIKASKSNLYKHIISLHEKFALGFACIILFFVGAPLGALIRKGGIGLPMVIAILLFLTYHFIGIFATNSAKNGGFNPILASWFSTLVMLPLGVFLTKRATADRGLFEGEGILEYLKKIFRIKKPEEIENKTIFDLDSEEYRELLPYENSKLIDIIKNYREYDFSIKYKNTALSILNSRGISNQQLKFSGNFSNEKVEEAIRLKNKYEEDSNLAFILYLVSLVLIITGRVLENNKFPLIGNILFISGLLIEILYLFALVKSFMSSSNYNKHQGKDSFSNALLFLLVGLPLYFIIYLTQKKKMNEDLHISKTSVSQKHSGFSALKCEDLKKEHNNYQAHSKFAITLNSIGIVLLVLFFVFKNNKLPSLAEASIQLSIVSLILFVIYYIKSILNTNQFYKHINKEVKKPNAFLLIIGLPLYIITYLFLNEKLKEDLKENCLDSLK